MHCDAIQTVRLGLELRADGAGLAGSLVDERGDAHAFCGWLGLLTLLESARAQLAPVETAR